MPPISRIAILAIGLLIFAPGAALAQTGDDQNDYTPAPQALAALSVDQASAVAIRQLPDWVIMLPDGLFLFIKQVKVGFSQIQLTDENHHVTVLPLAKAKITVSLGSFWKVQAISIDDVTLHGYHGIEKDQVEKLADALYVLKNAANSGFEDDAAFAQIVTSYRAATPKPSLPEDARRYQVQAEDAVKDGDFTSAVLLYGQALDVAPWWPGGHFNRAAVLAEIGEYSLAMAEMQRYLALVPEAPDARASQDKIYEWERLADKSDVRAAPASGSGAGNMGSLLGK